MSKCVLMRTSQIPFNNVCRAGALLGIWPLLLALISPAHATSVVAPSFSELVSEAQTIVRARVLHVRSAWTESPGGRVVRTYVTLAVQKRLKGAVPDELTLEFLGGEIDGAGMRVVGMPQFAEGDTDILFIAGNGMRFCPLVAMMHGRYRVRTENGSGRDFVTRDDGVPMESENDVQLAQAEDAASPQLKNSKPGLSLGAFEERIVQEVSRRAVP
jgi:hypothetical protein